MSGEAAPSGRNTDMSRHGRRGGGRGSNNTRSVGASGGTSAVGRGATVGVRRRAINGDISARSSRESRRRSEQDTAPTGASGSDEAQRSRHARRSGSQHNAFPLLVLAGLALVLSIGLLVMFYASLEPSGGRGGRGARQSRTSSPARRPAHPSGRKVRDTERQLTVSLEDAYNGATKTVRLPHKVICDACHGKGHDLAHGVKTCPHCGGSGTEVVVQRFGHMQQRIRTHCRHCRGTGQIVGKVCPVCHGNKLKSQVDTHKATIERGAASGDKLVIPAQGDQHPDAGPGDLVLHLAVQPHKVFTREGDDLHTKITITLAEALLGFTRTIRHLDGREVVVQRSDVTPHGHTITLSGDGMPTKEAWKKFGDLHVHVTTRFPSRLSKRQVTAVKELLPA